MREWLRTMRLEKGYTLKEMGDKLCISESYYSMIESGERQKKMDLTVATGLSIAFGVPVSQIISLEQNHDIAQPVQ